MEDWHLRCSLLVVVASEGRHERFSTRSSCRRCFIPVTLPTWTTEKNAGVIVGCLDADQHSLVVNTHRSTEEEMMDRLREVSCVHLTNLALGCGRIQLRHRLFVT